jgi:hypothetical protein
MKYTIKLEQVLSEKQIKKDNIVYMTIKQIYLQQMREGTKTVEYRDTTNFYIKKFFKMNTANRIETQKSTTHLLLQGGYNPDSPRILIELKGIMIYGRKYPLELDVSRCDIYGYLINLVLGEIAYDSTLD